MTRCVLVVSIIALKQIERIKSLATGKSGAADYPCSSAAGSYEEGLGRNIGDLQKKIPKKKNNQGKSSGAGMVTAAKAPSR
eukprot:CAMPEP_0201943960 /NCGR_PEP_ID=MMETSP0903-20130614/52178_1 /ASSEMBLY_ACC=CAM_ASM_000552 /TAXON_ID=420261 /ORGANISM="Thalassiosira antarctica, Strain CCMP982" /LENGTH=80 /DNA_ID=CAMNT_0048486827 /DNA_START=93 /DNA_END=331 /DNA_ORIENTATION=-